VLNYQQFNEHFSLIRLDGVFDLHVFNCSIDEYNVYLQEEAVQAQEDMIAVTYLLYDKETKTIAAYMSLIADAIKLNQNERELHGLNYPFKTMPAVKIAKLAVDSEAKKKYTGIGTQMVNVAAAIATQTYHDRFACRFLTVDADIEHDKGVLEFYNKNGFVPNQEMNKKNSIMINMRKDLYHR
jgi:hypothetical protein